ncbi:MAG TPA: methyltransferase domain-containing protein [Pseudonocardiaceae bacterium]
MTAERTPTSQDTSDFYDLSNRLVIDVWDENFHQGYYLSADDTSENRVAADRLTDLVIGKTGLTAGSKLLDIGCGIGQPAFRLLETTDVEIVGISNNEPQLEIANKRAEAKGLADKVRFEFADGQALPFDDDSFDAVWIFETIMHMDRLKCLGEALRVLKPGGVLVVTDQLLVGGEPSAEAAAKIEAFLSSMQASPLLDADAYAALIRDAGLELVELADLSANAKPTGQRMIDSVNTRWDELIATYGDEIAPILEMFRSPIGMIPELGYVLTVSRKPA